MNNSQTFSKHYKVFVNKDHRVFAIDENGIGTIVPNVVGAQDNHNNDDIQMQNDNIDDIIENSLDQVQSNHSVDDFGTTLVEFDVPDELDDEDEKVNETLVSIQERMLRTLVTQERIDQLECDETKIPAIVKSIKSLCTCGHGWKTLGCCYRTISRDNSSRRCVN
eukprot:9066_1